MKTIIPFALLAGLTIPAHAQELPTTGAVDSRLGKLERHEHGCGIRVEDEDLFAARVLQRRRRRLAKIGRLVDEETSRAVEFRSVPTIALAELRRRAARERLRKHMQLSAAIAPRRKEHCVRFFVHREQFIDELGLVRQRDRQRHRQ